MSGLRRERSRRFVGRRLVGQWLVGQWPVGQWPVGQWPVGQWLVGRRLVGLLAVLCAFLAGIEVGRVGPPGVGPDAASAAVRTAPAVGPPAAVGSADVVSEAAERIAASADQPVDPARLRASAITAMLGLTGDRWAAYLDPSERSETASLLAGSYVGLGIWLTRAADGAISVASVVPGSPAAADGIGPGARLLAVDGRPVTGRQVADVVTALRGLPGTHVTLLLGGGAGPAGAARTVRLARGDVTPGDLSSGWLAPGIAVLRVAAFTAGVGAQVRSAVRRLGGQGAHGFVLDLRGDPGGLVDEAVAVAGAFLDGGPVVSYGGRGAPARTLTAPAGGDVASPLAVLVDGATASAAEIVAGALQDRRRAVLVGSRTFGKGSVQQSFTLSDGSAVELTVATYRTPAGRSLDGVGLTPDVVVASPALAQARAVDVVRGLIASADPNQG